MKYGIFTLAACLLSTISLYAAPPDWWSAPETEIIDSEAEEENYAPANLGQLKHVAKQTQAHFNELLPEGSGVTIASLTASFEPRPGQGYTQQEIESFIKDNYSPLNLGQLKAVAKPFYDRLLESGYDTRANLIARGYPSNWAYEYPWDPQTPVSENYAPANIGQLKLVFSFDLSRMNFDPLADTDSNGLPDWWQNEYFESLGNHPASDPDEDGLSNLTEYLAGLDPNVTNGEVGPQFTATGLKVFTQLE